MKGNDQMSDHATDSLDSTLDAWAARMALTSAEFEAIRSIALADGYAGESNLTPQWWKQRFRAGLSSVEQPRLRFAWGSGPLVARI